MTANRRSSSERLKSRRVAWCRMTEKGRRVVDRSDLTIVLDGRTISDEAEFYLAIGEAVNGKDGYFGADLDALADCLCGGFGVRLPLTVKFRNSETARVTLGTFFNLIVAVLTERGVTVVIDDDS